jgi:hypothetical protein
MIALTLMAPDAFFKIISASSWACRLLPLRAPPVMKTIPAPSRPPPDGGGVWLLPTFSLCSLLFGETTSLSFDIGKKLFFKKRSALFQFEQAMTAQTIRIPFFHQRLFFFGK